MDGKIYGYVRVSTRDQREDRQVIALLEYGIPREQILVEKQSGKDFNRPVYQRLLKKLKQGDVLAVKSIDRLGRDYEEILDQWRKITKERQADIVVLDMPLLDTRKGKDLTGSLISDIVLQLLSYVAQTEREFIRQRQAEGIAAAKARGVRFGRRPKEKPPEYEEVLQLWAYGELSARKAAERLGVCHKTFLHWTKTCDREQQVLAYPCEARIGMERRQNLKQ